MQIGSNRSLYTPSTPSGSPPPGSPPPPYLESDPIDTRKLGKSAPVTPRPMGVRGYQHVTEVGALPGVGSPSASPGGRVRKVSAPMAIAGDDRDAWVAEDPLDY